MEERIKEERLDALYRYRVHSDPARLRIHPTAVVNNAIFNTGGGHVTVGEYVFFGATSVCSPVCARSTSWSRRWPVGAENSVTSCDQQILVYEAAEAISSPRSNGRPKARGERGRLAGVDGVIGAEGGCLRLHEGADAVSAAGNLRARPPSGRRRPG